MEKLPKAEQHTGILEVSKDTVHLTYFVFLGPVISVGESGFSLSLQLGSLGGTCLGMPVQPQ